MGLAGVVFVAMIALAVAGAVLWGASYGLYRLSRFLWWLLVKR